VLYPLEGFALCRIIHALVVRSGACKDHGLSGSMEKSERERAIVRVPGCHIVRGRLCGKGPGEGVFEC
ncbi:hypothetical protein POSPLADRAFT_1146776, partial [Postia placenta MAD-698-R-SB12]